MHGVLRSIPAGFCVAVCRKIHVERPDSYNTYSVKRTDGEDARWSGVGRTGNDEFTRVPSFYSVLVYYYDHREKLHALAVLQLLRIIHIIQLLLSVVCKITRPKLDLFVSCFMRM